MLIYAGIAAFGLLLLLILLFVGEIFGGDHDFGHDGDIGGHDGGPSIFSIRIMAAFLTAFGAGGVIARYYDLSHVAASAIGVVCGLVMAGVVYQFAKLLCRYAFSRHAYRDAHVQRPGRHRLAQAQDATVIRFAFRRDLKPRERDA